MRFQQIALLYCRPAMLSKESQLCAEEDLNADPENRTWLAKVLTSSGSSFAIAFVCTKALLPIRLPLTVAVTPAVARYVA